VKYEALKGIQKLNLESELHWFFFKRKKEKKKKEKFLAFCEQNHDNIFDVYYFTR
jgi:hypothetical protein